MFDIKDDFKKEIENIMGPDASKYFLCLEDKPQKGLCVNNKKISPEDFIKINNFKIEQLGFNENCFKYLGDEKLGLSVLHMAGAFYMQEPSAMIPGIVLPIKDGDLVLDMCASPGGKTFQIARRLNGVLLSNEIDFSRAKVLEENVERLGLDNVLVSSFSPQKLGELYEGVFDSVIVDAPCSGEGMFRREKQARDNWSKDYVAHCSKLQKEILLSATKCLKLGGHLVYSTCTFSKEENEENVKFLIDNGFEVLNIDKVFGGVNGISIKGYDTHLAKRFYPQNGVGEGQFVCLAKKVLGADNRELKKSKFMLLRRDESIVENFLKENFCGLWDKISSGLVKKNDSIFYSPNKTLILDEKKVLSFGVKLGVILNGRFEPSYNLFSAFGAYCKIKCDLTKAEAEEYFKGHTINFKSSEKGWCVVRYNGISLGGGKLVDGVIKNHYPKGLRK